MPSSGTSKSTADDLGSGAAMALSGSSLCTVYVTDLEQAPCLMPRLTRSLICHALALLFCIALNWSQSTYASPQRCTATLTNTSFCEKDRNLISCGNITAWHRAASTSNKHSLAFGRHCTATVLTPHSKSLALCTTFCSGLAPSCKSLHPATATQVRYF